MPVDRGGHDVLTLRLKAVDEEVVTAELWARGTLGLETRELAKEKLVIAYFERGRLAEDGWKRGPARLASGRAVVVDVGHLEDRDWLESYRRIAKPFMLGSSFWVDPRGGSDRTSGRFVPNGRILLELPAGRAFGTGSHESTRLAVELLEAQCPAGCSVLDLGAGSGILSLAAVALGALSVVAIEVDVVAALVAAQNRALNGMPFSLLAGRLNAIRRTPRFDLALVNMIPQRIAEDLPELTRRLKPSGRAIFSGFLRDQADEYERQLGEHGFRFIEARGLADWCAFLMRTEAEERSE